MVIVATDDLDLEADYAVPYDTLPVPNCGLQYTGNDFQLRWGFSSSPHHTIDETK